MDDALRSSLRWLAEGRGKKYKSIEITIERNEATFSFLGVPPRPSFSLRSMANRVQQFENERSENRGLGVNPRGVGGVRKCRSSEDPGVDNEGLD